MEFEFDVVKSQVNRIKHGIDFEQAQRLWEDFNYVVVPARTVDEARFIIIARIGIEIWSGIYTKRGKFIQIISVRRSRQNEKEIYQR